MSKQINNALSISRESGKSVKLETYTAHGEAGTPTPKLIQRETVDFSYNLRKDQELCRPDGKCLLISSPALDSVKGAGVQGPSPGLPRGRFLCSSGPPSPVVSWARGEAGLAIIATRAQQRWMARPSHRQWLSGGKGARVLQKERITLRFLGSTTDLSPKAADLSLSKRSKEKYSVLRSTRPGPLPGLGTRDKAMAADSWDPLWYCTAFSAHLRPTTTSVRSGYFTPKGWRWVKPNLNHPIN